MFSTHSFSDDKIILLLLGNHLFYAHCLFMGCYTYISISDPGQEKTADALTLGQSAVRAGPLDNPAVCSSLLNSDLDNT